MLTFAIVGFFSLTGVFLNHPDWTLGIAPKTAETKGILDRALLTKPDWIAIEAHLRSTDGVQGIAGEDQADDREASVRFSGPAYTADVVIDRATGAYTVKTERQGIVALLGDLHRGKDVGRPWSWAIDASGYFLTLIALTGFGMVFFLKKVKAKALITVAAGIVLMLILMKLASG